MPPKSDDDQATKSQSMISVPAAVHHLDSRALAKKLHENQSIYYGYAVFDSVSSSYSVSKCLFDMFIDNNDSDLMHKILMSVPGIIFVTLESLFLIGFSLYATRYEGVKEEDAKKQWAKAWPYFRDIIKSLKNAYKGWRNILVVVHLMGGDIKFLLTPVGLILGIFAARNRYWYREMTDKRKQKMENNQALQTRMIPLDNKLATGTIEEIYLDPINGLNNYLKQNGMGHQEQQECDDAFIVAATGGFVDSLYLYVGVVGLASLSLAMVWLMVALCIVYTCACITTRLYEEKDFQNKLLITQTDCKLELLTQQMRIIFQKLENNQIVQKDRDYFLKLMNQFKIEYGKLKDQSIPTYLTAILLGLKNGVYVYGTIVSILYLLGTVLLLADLAFPPLLLITSVILGLVITIGLIIHSVVTNHKYLEEEKVHPYDGLIKAYDELREENDFISKSRILYNDAEKKSVFLCPPPQFFVSDWAEVNRSLFSGLGKGQKFIDFAGNPWQEADEKGHYHDSKIMLVLSFFSSIAFGVVLALRALARGFGREKKSVDRRELLALNPIGSSINHSSSPSNTSTLNSDNAAAVNSSVSPINEVPPVLINSASTPSLSSLNIGTGNLPSDSPPSTPITRSDTPPVVNHNVSQLNETPSASVNTALLSQGIFRASSSCNASATPIRSNTPSDHKSSPVSEASSIPVHSASKSIIRLTVAVNPNPTRIIIAQSMFKKEQTFTDINPPEHPKLR